MKATVIGFKKFTGKDGRKWVQIGCVYNDINAVGGAFASSVLASDENNLSASLVPGEAYNLDFDNRGGLLGIEKIVWVWRSAL